MPSSPPHGSASSRRLFRHSAATETASTPPSWPVLVVDDDSDIHAMTRVLLRDFRFQDRPFEVISAYSGSEARQILAERPEIPVMLLDVVMETPHAGLDLVRYVRQTLENHRIAIVLRTGQPGEAPEREVMQAYDINDYRNKTDLTAQCLFTALVSGLRSWLNLTRVETMAQVLEQEVATRTHALAAALRFSDSLFDRLPIPVWVEDETGRLTRYNSAFRDLFGGKAEDWSNSPCLAPTLPPTQPCQAVELAVVAATGPIEAILRRHPLAPPESGTIGTLIDITRSKELERRLRDLATIDDLTGILNRRAFFAAATHEIDRAGRYATPVSMVMIDLDHFKQINDRYGHAVGDAALRLTAAAMVSSLREVDRIGRLGGEEFAVLLPQTPLAGAIEVAERLRRAIAAVAVPIPPPPAVTYLTASLGVAEHRLGTVGPDAVLNRADAALYRAKREGRNCVVHE